MSKCIGSASITFTVGNIRLIADVFSNGERIEEAVTLANLSNDHDMTLEDVSRMLGLFTEDDNGAA